MFILSRKQSGFTIIELLIVIVIIAILAAITLVAYNGIQQRAENTTTIQAVTNYAKALQSYKVINGVYPPPGGTYACIAGASAVCGNVTDTTQACFNVAQIRGTLTLDTQMKTILSSLPQPSTQQMACSAGQSYSGAMYDGSRLIWYLKGTQPCNSIAGLSGMNTQQSGGVTQCLGYLP